MRVENCLLTRLATTVSQIAQWGMLPMTCFMLACLAVEGENRARRAHGEDVLLPSEMVAVTREQPESSVAVEEVEAYRQNLAVRQKVALQAVATPSEECIERAKAGANSLAAIRDSRCLLTSAALRRQIGSMY